MEWKEIEVSKIHGKESFQAIFAGESNPNTTTKETSKTITFCPQPDLTFK